MDESNDPAAVFACALSLHTACLKAVDGDPSVNLSEAYQGGDQFMREMMRVADLFETWACEHVQFESLNDVWPYLLEDRFGDACLAFMGLGDFAGFDRDDCLRVAFKLRLPIRVDGTLPVPVCVEAANPNEGADFVRLRIQTIREELGDDGEVLLFGADDEPFDENFHMPVFGIYGVNPDGRLEHIAHRANYDEARGLLRKLMPAVCFPENVVAFHD